jgi:hypothetical protein
MVHWASTKMGELKNDSQKRKLRKGRMPEKRRGRLEGSSSISGGL